MFITVWRNEYTHLTTAGKMYRLENLHTNFLSYKVVIKPIFILKLGNFDWGINYIITEIRHRS